MRSSLVARRGAGARPGGVAGPRRFYLGVAELSCSQAVSVVLETNSLAGINRAQT